VIDVLKGLSKGGEGRETTRRWRPSFKQKIIKTHALQQCSKSKGSSRLLCVSPSISRMHTSDGDLIVTFALLVVVFIFFILFVVIGCVEVLWHVEKGGILQES
jgi:hypothetical protein